MITLHKVDNISLFAAYCKLHNKWGVYVSLPENEEYSPERNQEIVRETLPFYKEYWTSEVEVIQDGINFGFVMFLSETEEEVYSIYKQVDSLYSYCTVASPQGILLSENT